MTNSAFHARMLQPDLLRDSPARLADAYRDAAQAELLNPHYTLAERQARHDYYAAEAARIEGEG